jgi:hypothetical protein
MLVKVNKIDDAMRTISVTLLDIDEFGSVVPIQNLNLKVLAGDSYIIELLKSSSHAIIFTQDFSNMDNSVVISALSLTDDELNDEKEKIIKKANRIYKN